jgi:hypothetical protein
MSTTAHELRDAFFMNMDRPFTVGHRKWLEEGGTVTPSAFKTLMEIQVDDYFKVDRSDGSGRLRASGFSMIGYPKIQYCERRHLLSYLGITGEDFDSGSREMMNTGTQLHYYYQLAGLSAGWLAEAEVPISYEPWILRGSMDGLLADGTGLEIKTTGSHIYSKMEQRRKDHLAKGQEEWRAASLAHLWQIHMYMEAADLDKFSLVYIDRGYPSRFTELRVPRDEAIMNDVNAALTNLVEHIRDEFLPPMLEECQMRKGPTYEGCSFRESCPTVRGFA